MIEKTPRRFFIPPWLDELDLKPHPFRVLCHLLRRAGDDGRCFPSASAIATSCRISKDTVWPALKTLEEAGLVTRLPKRFGGSNTYLITPPIGGNNGVIGDEPIGGKGGSIEKRQSPERAGRESQEKEGSQSAAMAGCKEIPLKESKLKKSIRQISPAGTQFALWFKSSLPESVNLKPNWKQSFAEIYDELVVLDHRTPEQIKEVSLWGRSDPFWKTNFMSPSKLRERNAGGIQYFDVFVEKMRHPSGQTLRASAAVNTGGRDTNNFEDV